MGDLPKADGMIRRIISGDERRELKCWSASLLASSSEPLVPHNSSMTSGQGCLTLFRAKCVIKFL